MAANPIFVGVINTEVQEFDNADGTTAKTIFTAGASGSRVDAIVLCTDDTAAKFAHIAVVRGGVTYKIARVTLNYGAAITSTNILANIAGIGQLGLVLESGDTLTLGYEAALTAGKVSQVLVLGGDF